MKKKTENHAEAQQSSVVASAQQSDKNKKVQLDEKQAGSEELSVEEDKLKYPTRPKRVVLTREEIIKRMESFPERAPKIIEAVKKARDNR